MLFVTYWETNENMSVEDRMQVAQKLTSSGMFPPENVEIIRWDTTPDGWGVLIAEAESAQAIGDAINMWRSAGAGFFKVTRTAPATPATEAIPHTVEMLQKLASG